MGQKSSKRQSYTPGTTQDAGLPTASVAENGDIKSGGANGQVQLISSRETQSGDVITADVTSSSSVAAAASYRPPETSQTEKKKRRTPRFVFSLKRTGSGKRSRKARKEANGVRPTSYPPALHTDETAGPRATDRQRKAQSMFVEEILEDVQEEVTPSPSSDGTGKEGKKSTSAKKTSVDSTASTSRAQKDKKRNGSQKQKSPSKKKGKEAKKKSKKEKEEADKTKEEGEDDSQAAAAPAAAATAPAAVVEDIVVPETETTQEQEPSLQAASADTGKGTENIQIETEDKEDVSKVQPATKEEAVEPATELTVADVTEAEVKLIFPENITEEPLIEAEQPAMTAEELLAEIEQTILSKEEKEPIGQETQDAVHLKETNQVQPEQENVIQAEVQVDTQITQREKVELAGQAIDEDILELVNIPSNVTDLAQQERSRQTEEPVMKEVADQKTETAADTTEEVMERTITMDVQSAAEAVRQEAVSDTVQQQVEKLVECTPSTETITKLTEDEAERETDRSQTQAPEQSSETSQSIAPNPEQDVARPEASASEEPAADNASKPAEDSPSSMTPAQLRALEKERKAARKREEKERAKREKEEKKRLKEEKKREAREKKKREKEEKEQKLREAKEKARVSANMTIEVQPDKAAQEAVEEAVTVSQTVMVESTPDMSASTEIQPQQEEEKSVIVEPQPSTSAEFEEVIENVQLSESVDVDDVAVSTTIFTPPPETPATTKTETGDQFPGSSVKEIISSFENNVAPEPKTYDENIPPEIPDTPYPEEEEVIQQSSAVAQFSAAPASPDSSGPASPVAEDSTEDDAERGASPEPASASKTIFPPEVSESARSSVLRKIELGPRLRTAILRKSSSGAEKEEKRVSLTQPRHVQVSDLTPPPRKPRARRPLEHSRDSSGNYRYSSHSPTTSPHREPESVMEEHLTVEITPLSSSSPSSSPSEQKAEESEGTGGGSEGIEMREAKGQLIEVTSSLSQSLQLPSSQTANNTEEKTESSHEDNIQFNDQLMEGSIPSGCGPSTHTEPDSPAVVAVSNIVRAGQTDGPDTRHTQSLEPSEEGEKNTEGVQTHTAVSADGQGQADDQLLQKVAAGVVVHVQKVAQEKASALELQEKVVQIISDSSGQANVSEISDGSVRCQDSQAKDSNTSVEECGYKSDKENDSDSEAGLVQATVVCSAELVTPSSEHATLFTVSQTADCQTVKLEESQSQDSCGTVDSDSKQSETETSDSLRETDTQVCQGASEQSQAVVENTVRVVETSTVSTEPSKHDEISVKKETEAESSSPAESNTDLRAEGTQANQDIECPEDKTDEEISTDTSQLQQFNKNYYISVVVDDDDDDEDDMSKTQSTAVDSTPGDNPEQDSLKNESSDCPTSSEEPSSTSERTQSCSQQAESSSGSGQPLETPQLCSSQLKNGEAHEEKVGQSEQDEKVKMTVRCNGSHVRNEDDANDSIDALLKLRSGLNGEKEMVRDVLEHNNNVSTEERTESAASGTTNDSQD